MGVLSQHCIAICQLYRIEKITEPTWLCCLAQTVVAVEAMNKIENVVGAFTRGSKGRLQANGNPELLREKTTAFLEDDLRAKSFAVRNLRSKSISAAQAPRLRYRMTGA